jgi:lipopolysaccharide transport system ATP-binding protein
MNDSAIAVRNLSKKYYLGVENYNVVGETLVNLAISPLRKLIGKSKYLPDRKRQVIWALQGINFDISHGERVGIIGKNGAGKSTLLKILSRLVYPTEGEARIRRRVTSLLEVGTGFNANLSGRENIYLNATLHGLQHHEIDEIFEDIVKFSEIEKFIDTPVRHYSSGMYMRLAFAVAAHLDPDILLLDEVLAVGDMSFQQKCLQRVDGLTSEGRTVLFVSHSMDSIARFCDRCIWLEEGRIVEDGPTEEVIASYVQKVMGIQSNQKWVEDESKQSQKQVSVSNDNSPAKQITNINDRNSQNEHNPSKSPQSQNLSAFNIHEHEYFRLVSAKVINAQGKAITTAPVHEPIGIEIVYDILNTSKNIQPALHLKTAKDVFAFVVAYTDPEHMYGVSRIGRYIATAWIPPNLLNVGLMHVTLAMVTPDPQERHIQIERAISFNVHEIEGIGNTARGLYARDFPGVVRPMLTWETKYVEAPTNALRE